MADEQPPAGTQQSRVRINLTGKRDTPVSRVRINLTGKAQEQGGQQDAPYVVEWPADATRNAVAAATEALQPGGRHH